MKTLIILFTTTTLFCNCVNNPPIKENLINSEKILLWSSLLDHHMTTFITYNPKALQENLWAYWFELLIFDFKGGGYSIKNIYNLGVNHCVHVYLDVIHINKVCVEDVLTDYADPLQFIIKMEHTPIKRD